MQSPNRTTLKSRLAKAHEAAKAAIVKRIHPIVKRLRERHDQLVDVVRDERTKAEENVERRKAKLQDLGASVKQRAEQDKARFDEMRSRQRDVLQDMEDTASGWVRGVTDEVQNLANDIEDVRKEVNEKAKSIDARGRVAWKLRQAKAASITAMLDNVARLEALDMHQSFEAMADEPCCEGFGEREAEPTPTPEVQVEVLDPESEWLAEHDPSTNGYYAPPPSPTQDN